MSLVWGLLGLLAFIGSVTVGDICSEEIRSRLDRLPKFLLRLAARRLPVEIREDRLKEWEGELHIFLRGAEALPVTRLVRGLRFAVSLLIHARSIGRALTSTELYSSRSIRWLQPARNTVRMTVITVSLFVLACGVGMGNIYIFAIAAPALLAAVATFIRIRRGRQDLFGTARVRYVSKRPVGGAVRPCDLTLIVTAPGISDAIVELHRMVPVSDWPVPGVTFAVRIPGGNLRKTRILTPSEVRAQSR